MANDQDGYYINSIMIVGSNKTYFIQLPGEPLNKYSWAYMSHFYGAMFIFAAKYLFRLPVIGLKNIGEIYPSQYEVE